MSKKKVRVEMRKNRNKPPRENDFTRDFRDGERRAVDADAGERVRAKGEQSRHRTIVQDTAAAAGSPDAGAAAVRGRVLRVHGLQSVVEAEEGRLFRCAVRRLLKTLATDERNAVTTGDVVWFRPSNVEFESKGQTLSEGEGFARDPRFIAEPLLYQAGMDKLAQEIKLNPSLNLNPLPPSNVAPLEGIIEKVEPRHGVLTRSSRRREHILVANVDQLAIVVSLVEPNLKPHLIDRYVAAAQKGGLKPVLCLNKADRRGSGRTPAAGRVLHPVGHRHAAHERRHLSRRGPASRTPPRPGDGLFRAVRRGEVVAAQRHPAGLGPFGEGCKRREPEGAAHDHLRPTAAARRRRLGGGHAGRATARSSGTCGRRRWKASSGTSARSCRCAASRTAPTRTRPAAPSRTRWPATSSASGVTTAISGWCRGLRRTNDSAVISPVGHISPTGLITAGALPVPQRTT